MIKTISIVLLSVFLFSCASPKIEPEPTIVQESLLVKCTYNTPVPEKFELDKEGNKVYTGSEMIRVLIEWQNVYSECATVHDALVDTVLGLEQLKK